MSKSNTRRIPAYYRSAEWRDLRLAVIERDGGICRYCGSKQGIQADHVMPRRKGGADTLENLVCSCSGCNRVAGNRKFKSFDAKRSWIRQRRGLDPIPGALPGELAADTRARLKRKNAKRYRPKKRKRVQAPPLIEQNGGGVVKVEIIRRADDD